MTTLSTYQNLIEKVGLAKLDPANKDTYNIVKEGSANFSDPNLWNEMLADADIKEVYELHVKALQNLSKEEPKAEMRVDRKEEKKIKQSRVKQSAKPKRSPRKAKNNVEKKVEPKKSTSKRRKKTKKVSVKKAAQAKAKHEVKFPVTVKRLSKELQLIKRLANMDGKRKTVNALTLFHRELKKILNTHPDRKPVLNDMYNRITGAVHKATKAGVKELDITLEKSFKNKLLINVRNPKPKMKVEFLAGLDEKKKPKEEEKEKEEVRASSSPILSRGNLFQNINHIDHSVKESFKLKGDLGNFLGDLEKYKLAISIEGDQGAGKTQLAFQLADGFVDIGYSVGMFQLEIGAASNIIVKNREKYIKPTNRSRVAIAGEAPNGIDTIREYAKKFGVIIIDSWTKLEVDSIEFDKLRKDFPDTIWIVLFQRTSANKIRGGTKPLYDAGINIEVVKADETFINNYAVATKNRYGQTGLRYNISKQKITA